MTHKNTDNEKNTLGQHTVMGHIRLLPKIIVFGMGAYALIHLLMWISARFGGKF